MRKPSGLTLLRIIDEAIRESKLHLRTETYNGRTTGGRSVVDRDWTAALPDGKGVGQDDSLGGGASPYPRGNGPWTAGLKVGCYGCQRNHWTA